MAIILTLIPLNLRRTQKHILVEPQIVLSTLFEF